MRHRPALDARLNLLVTLLAEAQGVSGTLAIDGVVRAGLEGEGLKDAVDLVLNARIESKEDLEALAQRVRPIIAALELEGTQMQMIAS